MTVKRFVAPDMRRALDLVREEMGPDAIILSSQRTAQGVEIITSLDTDLPTRGADTRKTFGQQFDEELDSPLESDAAWKTHQGMAQAAQKYRPQNTTAQTFGGDSAGTLPMSSERAKALADKIEQAREKMLAAKRVEQTQVQPDAYDRSTQDSIRQSRHSSGQNNNSPNSADRASNGYDSPAHNVSVKSARVRKEPVISEPLHRETTASYEPQMQTTAMVQNSPDIGCAPAVNSEPFCHNPPQEQMLSQDQILPPIHSEPDANFLADWQPDFYRNMPEVSEPSLDRQMAGLQAEVRQKAAEQSAAKHQESDANDRRLQGLQDQLADMRLLLEQQMWSNRDSRSAPKANSVAGETIVRNLEQMGLPSNVTQKLALTATPGKSLSAAWRESLALLTRKVPTVSEDLVKHGGVFAFVGPTGVGKTTTIAKLASRYVLEHGLGKVALITTDTYRVGAHDQLRSLGRILNVPVRVVDRERSLARPFTQRARRYFRVLPWVKACFGVGL